ncbi:Hsp70 family protein [Dactylosporangium sp. AC04546]|uniref:Hsp70 family protein n=1 Tax=Dactylosporangium sp. AC04546 TaxID=2862460 RepID=UPI001EDFA3ED|nr:Hsp70 family protein [Dactylosporangium sp. AC04546]WVK80596.1 Hsp70 family protein [Dactylosporangium sp. AC04546]
MQHQELATAVLVAIDFGTSNTAAVVRLADGRHRQVLFDGAPLLPSAVFAAENGEIVVGHDAVLLSRQAPHRFEPNPKRRIDEGTLLLGDREWPLTDVVAAVLRRVSLEAERIAGQVAGVVLTHPATWGPQRRGVLTTAAEQAGLPIVALVAEPIAAAGYFRTVFGRALPPGSSLGLLDLGGGTLDLALVTNTADGLQVTATAGLDDVGGLDIDAALVTHAGTRLAQRAPQQWQRLQQPSTIDDHITRATFWSDACSAKEMLSRASTAPLPAPAGFDAEHLTRAEFDQIVTPLLDRVVAEAHRLFTPQQQRLVGPFLVGGSSRIPLLAHLLHRELGRAPVVLEQPDLAVAEGALTTIPVPPAEPTNHPATGTTPPPPARTFAAHWTRTAGPAPGPPAPNGTATARWAPEGPSHPNGTPTDAAPAPAAVLPPTPAPSLRPVHRQPALTVAAVAAGLVVVIAAAAFAWRLTAGTASERPGPGATTNTAEAGRGSPPAAQASATSAGPARPASDDPLRWQMPAALRGNWSGTAANVATDPGRYATARLQVTLDLHGDGTGRGSVVGTYRYDFTQGRWCSGDLLINTLTGTDGLVVSEQRRANNNGIVEFGCGGSRNIEIRTAVDGTLDWHRLTPTTPQLDFQAHLTRHT